MGFTVASGINLVTNPPFDPRIRSIPVHGGRDSSIVKGGLYRGRIETDKAMAGIKYRFQFLYNPTDVSWGGSVQTNIVADPSARPVGDAGQNYIMPSGQSVSFNLWLDRTYDSWVYDPENETSRLGVVADIKYLYAMLGVLSTVTRTGTTGTSNFESDKLAIESVLNPTPTGFMQYVPIWAILSPYMTYYGVITGLNITYMQWTQRMTPTRCQVQVSMNLMPPLDTATSYYLDKGLQKNKYLRQIHKNEHNPVNGAQPGNYTGR